MKKRRTMTELEKARWHTYHIPGGGHRKTRRLNELNWSIANTLEHETAKFQKMFELVKEGHLCITEAAENKSPLIRDLVDLTDGEIYEFESELVKRGHRHPKNINTIWYKEKKKKEESKEYDD